MGYTSTIGTFGSLSFGSPWGFSGGPSGFTGAGSFGSGGGGSTTTVAQKSVPTSQYGQTVPVLWGKARVPGSYVWAPEIIVKTTTTSTSFGWAGPTSTTTVSVLLSARVRFGAPLEADSTWKLRRLWSNGVLIFDASTGYRKSGLSFRFYDGRSTQGRDPHMVAKEGEANVSAHRGYIDVVFQSFNIGSAADGPPIFEAEVIQDATSSVDEDDFITFFADAINTYAAPDWEAGEFYGYSSSANLIRRFSIGGLREFYAVSLNGLGRAYTSISEQFFHYIPEYDRLIAIGRIGGFLGNMWPLVIDPTTGEAVGEGDLGMEPGGGGQVVNAACCIVINGAGVFIASTFHLGYLSVFTISNNSAARVYLSDSGWGGRGVVECFTAGEIREDDADVWVCAGSTLYKMVVSSNGLVASVTAHATFADDLRYAVYHEGDLVVWDDAAQAIRVDGTTGATEWTKTVPYQIAVANQRSLSPPDSNRLDGELLLQASTFYYFTDLETGSTRSVSKSSEVSAWRYVYDALTDTVITTDNADLPQRRKFDAVGSGATRNLEDFLTALMTSGENFDASEIEVIGVDDQIQGAVIDITSGRRDVARAVCEPYSIAMFERAGKIIFKRAATDGSFAVDATVSSTDLVDSGGQAIRARQLNPEEFIARFGISYRDPDHIYQATTQFGEIPSIPFPVAPTDLSVKADIPVITDADTIKVLATKKVNKLAVERHEFTLTLRAKFGDLEPEDVIQFTFANRLITARVVEANPNPDFTIEVKATEFLSSTSVSISGATGRPVEPSPAGLPNSRYYHLDIPLLADTHDLGSAGLVQYHVLASGGQTYWDGATLFRTDAAGTYQAVVTQVENGLVGVALEVLPDTDNPYVTEFTRTLDVSILSGDTSLLVTKTYLEVMNGANLFAIGQPGRWEVCQVMTITNNANGTYTFEGLVRGRGVSEEHTGSHAIGDYVVWLSDDNVQRLEYSLTSLDDAFNFKPVGFGGALSSTPEVSRTVTGEAEKIPKPCQLDAVINASDIDLSWVRRSRIGSFWADDGDDFYSTPLGETLEQYVIRIKSGPGGSVLRTFTVDDATTKKYLSADITTDFGSMPASLTFDIRQVSGTGVICPTREATIDL